MSINDCPRFLNGKNLKPGSKLLRQADCQREASKSRTHEFQLQYLTLNNWYQNYNSSELYIALSRIFAQVPLGTNNLWKDHQYFYSSAASGGKPLIAVCNKFVFVSLI